jgi:serine protease
MRIGSRSIRRVILLVAVVGSFASAQGVSPAPSPDTEVTAIVVKFRDDAGVRMGSAGKLTQKASAARGVPMSALQSSFTALEARAKSNGLRLKRHFSKQSEETLDRWVARGRARSGKPLADLNSYYSMNLRRGTRYAQVADLVAALAKLPHVETAYAAVKPVPAQGALTPDMTAEQDYVDAAPAGINAAAGWALPGGRGLGVRIADVEFSWNLAHEDLPAVDDVEGWPFASFAGFVNHGTAVLGILGALDNGHGPAGLVTDATLGVSSIVEQLPTEEWGEVINIAGAIANAAEWAGEGGIVFLEVQVGGGPITGSSICTNPDEAAGHGYLPVEWEQANYDAIAAATAAGVLVFVPAANGGVDLDHASYLNRFNRNSRDSGAIYVGASEGAARTPACFSNFGTRVDVHGWGRNVTTLGYGDRWPTSNDHLHPNALYTSGFNGTSSATPIVVSSAAMVQGVRLAAGQQPLTPAQMRDLLRNSGTPQTTPVVRAIGPLPNVGAAIGASGSGRNLGWLPAVLNLLLGD